MVAERRMGSIDSEKGDAMLDAAELILLEEGYAALTSRRVAEQTGVKQRLVYYYFRTMDELVLETFKRLARRELERLEEAARCERPVHALWDIWMNTSDVRIVAEFMAIANRNEGLRQEVVSFIGKSRRIQAKVIQKAASKSKAGTKLMSPESLAFLGTGLALALNREAALGVKAGHSVVSKKVKELVELVEP